MQLPLVWFTLRNGGLSPVLCVLNIKLLGFLYKQLYSTHHCYCCRAKSAEANTWGVIKVIAISPPLHRIHFPLETDYSHLINTESLVCARLYFRLVGETEPDTLFLPHNLSSFPWHEVSAIRWNTFIVQLPNHALLFVTPTDCNTPGSSVLHYLLEFAQIHVRWVGNVIEQSHPLSPHHPPSLNLSQH